MNIRDFKEKYIGKKVRDGQCVALFRQYAEECFGIPHTGSVEGAINIWETRNSNPKIRQYFDVVDGRPQEGDVVFFNPSSSNKYGHVALVLEDRGDGFNCLEQDGFKPDMGAKSAFWTWTRFAGALRPKTV
jgi:cell wall-associated NlpC family hydrolase